MQDIKRKKHSKQRNRREWQKGMKTVLFRETASGFLWLRQGEGRGKIMDTFLCARQRHSNLSGTQFSPQWNRHDEALVTIRRTNARTDLYTRAGISGAPRELQLLHSENHEAPLQDLNRHSVEVSRSPGRRQRGRCREHRGDASCLEPCPTLRSANSLMSLPEHSRALQSSRLQAGQARSAEELLP